jgi:hypothetical protein
MSQKSSNATNLHTAPAFENVEGAAVKLGIDAEALRARCRRAAKRRGDATVAHLGGGIVAFKFGTSWRVRFPQFWTALDQAIDLEPAVDDGTGTKAAQDGR